MPRYEKIPDFIRSWTEMEIPFGGAAGWMVRGEKQQVVFVEFGERLEVPEHSHEEQWEFALAGEVELHMDGRTRVFGPGDNFFIPAGRPHGATVHAGYKAMIVFNERDRYKAKA